MRSISVEGTSLAFCVGSPACSAGALSMSVLEEVSSTLCSRWKGRKGGKRQTLLENEHNQMYSEAWWLCSSPLTVAKIFLRKGDVISFHGATELYYVTFFPPLIPR